MIHSEEEEINKLERELNEFKKQEKYSFRDYCSYALEGFGYVMGLLASGLGLYYLINATSNNPNIDGYLSVPIVVAPLIVIGFSMISGGAMIGFHRIKEKRELKERINPDTICLIEERQKNSLI